eukprot:GHRR01012022.1.p2 GENE.GHRR01012022.1~~GHRR01012022.1.p2  ORF type:complete len:131 (-),score=15.72 GHRR01012022.1:253-645(-)
MRLTLMLTLVHKQLGTTQVRKTTLWHVRNELIQPKNPQAHIPAPMLADVLMVATPRVRVAGWCAMRRGCSPSGTVRMCSFWIPGEVAWVRMTGTRMVRAVHACWDLYHTMCLSDTNMISNSSKGIMSDPQ